MIGVPFEVARHPDHACCPLQTSLVLGGEADQTVEDADVEPIDPVVERGGPVSDVRIGVHECLEGLLAHLPGDPTHLGELFGEALVTREPGRSVGGPGHADGVVAHPLGVQADMDEGGQPSQVVPHGSVQCDHGQHAVLDPFVGGIDLTVGLDDTLDGVLVTVCDGPEGAGEHLIGLLAHVDDRGEQLIGLGLQFAAHCPPPLALYPPYKAA